jgi:ATP sulfurylase
MTALLPATQNSGSLWAGHTTVFGLRFFRTCAGCTHFIVGRDMAGSKSSITGEDFYGMYDAQVSSGAARAQAV